MMGTSLSAVPRASNPQSQRTTSSTSDRLPDDGITPPSPLVPAGLDPDFDLGGAFEHVAEEFLDLGAPRERLRLLGRLPDIDAQEVAVVLRIEVHDVRDVAGLTRHLLGR